MRCRTCRAAAFRSLRQLPGPRYNLLPHSQRCVRNLGRRRAQDGRQSQGGARAQHSEGCAQGTIASPRASPTSSIDGSDRPEGTLFPQSPSTEARSASQRHRRRKRLPQASPSPLASPLPSPSSAGIVHMRNGGTFEAFRSPGGDETLSSSGHTTFDALCRRGGWYLRNQCPALTHNIGTRLLRGVEAGCGTHNAATSEVYKSHEDNAGSHRAAFCRKREQRRATPTYEATTGCIIVTHTTLTSTCIHKACTWKC